MRCQYCANLSIEHLIGLAQREFSAFSFPLEAFYQHHASFRDLVESANGGCDLCRLITDAFKSTRVVDDLEESLYDAALDQHSSEVKLAINTSHVYVGTLLDEVQVLNTLLIQVGFPDEAEGAADLDTLPYLILNLSTLPERPIALRGFKIGRFRVDTDLSSVKNFAIARTWLHECRAHDSCFTSQARKLPKRVVDIGPLDGPISPRILLTRGAEADYIALSHCWGGRISTMLTADTYDGYQRRLPYNDLPPNFRDALIISKELGIRYIWIDSLCIIQDSKSDWEEESKKMATIYAMATLTVSAGASEKSTTGILKTYNSYKRSAPEAVSLRVFEDQACPDEVQVEWRPSGEENFRLLDLSGPLSQRGWTLQEYFLSPSTLLFGSRQIYWRCAGHMKSADGMPEGNEFPESKYRAASRTAFSGLFPRLPKVKLDMPALLQDYYELAGAYSTRTLTFGTDKLPAFSGVARSLHPAIGGEYLAGLWTSDFQHGLLWQTDMKTAKHVKPYRAPSWSWLVCDISIIFMERKRLRPNKMNLELLRHDVVLQDKTNPFGPVLSSHVIVRGRTTPLLRSKHAAAGSYWKSSYGTVQFDEVAPSCESSRFDLRRYPFRGSKSTFEYMPRSTDEKVFERDDHKPVSESDLLILLVRAGEEIDRDGETTAAGLAVRRVLNGGGNTYERIGTFNFLQSQLEWFESWDMQTLMLV